MNDYFKTLLNGGIAGGISKCIVSFDRDLEHWIDELGKNHRDYKKIEALYDRYHQYDD